MQLNIISPSAKKKYEIQWIELNTPAGSFIIQADHAPMVVQLADHKPVTFCYTSGAQETMTPVTAVAHITREKVDLLISE